MARVKRITIRLDKDEYRAIKSLAFNLKLTLAETIRTCLFYRKDLDRLKKQKSL